MRSAPARWYFANTPAGPKGPRARRARSPGPGPPFRYGERTQPYRDAEGNPPLDGLPVYGVVAARSAWGWAGCGCWRRAGLGAAEPCWVCCGAGGARPRRGCLWGAYSADIPGNAPGRRGRRRRAAGYGPANDSAVTAAPGAPGYRARPQRPRRRCAARVPVVGAPARGRRCRRGGGGPATGRQAAAPGRRHAARAAGRRGGGGARRGGGPIGGGGAAGLSCHPG